MEITGRVQDGVVVLDSSASLPEGAAVSVVFPALHPERAAVQRRRVQLPLVHCDHPGSVALTSARISEILDARGLDSSYR
jgi:hypothetical protein